MKLTGNSKTRESKYNATVTLFASIGMLVVALIAFDFSDMPTFGKIFLIVWCGVACAQIYQAYRNSIFSNKNLHQEITDHDIKVSSNESNSRNKFPQTTDNPEKDYAMRLRKLEGIYRDGLITTAEYEAKRKDILDEDWGA